MVKTAHRIDRSYKIADWSEVQRIYYAVTLTAFLHRWALVIISILIPSAHTVLQFLAALNRASKIGYKGCAVAYELLGPHIATATGRKCSPRTLERGVSALAKLGLVKLTWWTMPDQFVQNGPYEHKINGTGKVKTRDGYGWTSRQIRIIILTPRAIGLWDRRTAKKGSDIIPHFAPFLTPAKLAASSQIDQVDKPTMINQPRTKSESSTCVRREDQEIGQTTSPPTASTAVEHVASTSTQGDSSPDSVGNESALANSPEFESDAVEFNDLGFGGLTGEQHPCHDSAVIISPEGSDDQMPEPVRNLKTPKTCVRGCSHTPPPLPKNSKNKTSWPVARAYLLVEIHRCLSNFSTHEANSIYERAVWELSPDYPRGFPTIVDWAYWVARFALFSPRQRRGHVYRDILPLLRSTAAPPVPSEPRIFSSSKYSVVDSDGNTDKLTPFLKNVWKKFVGD